MKLYNVFKSILLASLLLMPATSPAENIDPMAAGAQYVYQENSGWINAEPQGNGGNGITVYADHLEGYIWAENIGWINLSPLLYGGVTNDGSGELSGYAWSENCGWINFAPTGGGVKIDFFTGTFCGWAWGENIGWINFDIATQGQYVARTSWSGWQEDGDLAINWDSDPDGDGIVNLDDLDADDDGLDNYVELTLWGENWNVDFDGDGLYNLIDEDADGDGVLDGTDSSPGGVRSSALPAVFLMLLE